MKALFPLVRHPLDVDQSELITSLLSLRVVMLFFAGLFMCAWHFGYAAFDYLPWALAAVLVAGLWSAVVFSVGRLQRAKRAILREMLVEYAWVLLIVLLAGRSANPFMYYYLVLTAVSAALLPARQAWMLCLAGIAIYSGLLLLDSKEHFRHFSADYRVHLVGMWVNYVGSTLVTCFFVVRLMRLLRVQHAQLSAVREENLKSEQLIGLATVAASTVHNLATPIATLTVLVDELAGDPAISGDIRADAELMRAQIGRCQTTMKALSSVAQRGASQAALPVSELVNFLREHYALHHPNRMPEIRCAVDDQCKISCNALFQYALVNLINNAIESSASAPLVSLATAADKLKLVIENHSALSAENISKRWGKLSQSEKANGLGFGSFLANSTIEKQGGTVELAIEVNPARNGEAKGAETKIVVTVFIPLVFQDSGV